LRVNISRINLIARSNMQIENRFINSTINYIKENFGILLGLLAMSTILSVMTPAFLTTDNILNVLRQVSSNANIAFGMTFVIIITGIDLSVGAIVALSGTVAAGFLVRHNIPVMPAAFIGITIGTLIGFINGFMRAKTKMPYFIVTLAMYQIARGAAYVYTGGNPISTTNQDFALIGNGYLGPIPLPIIYSIFFLVACSLLLNKTKFGRYVYAIGGNRDAAKFSGINIERVEILVFTLIGFLCGVTGVVLSARMWSGQPNVAQGWELDAIAAVVIGGTSFSGGRGKIGGTALGVLVIGVLNNGLNLLNINSFWQLIAKGMVILLAVYIDILKKRKS
jgi:ribose transport system permease protein